MDTVGAALSCYEARPDISPAAVIETYRNLHLPVKIDDLPNIDAVGITIPLPGGGTGEIVYFHSPDDCRAALAAYNKQQADERERQARQLDKYR
jgi:hypothetical protein